jgi:hypothetical protein
MASGLPSATGGRTGWTKIQWGPVPVAATLLARHSGSGFRVSEPAAPAT